MSKSRNWANLADIMLHIHIQNLRALSLFSVFQLPPRSSTMAKSDKKAEKKSVNPAKAVVKPKVSKKVVSFEKPVATIPSAKHGAPISSKEILARVCILL